MVSEHSPLRRAVNTGLNPHPPSGIVFGSVPLGTRALKALEAVGDPLASPPCPGAAYPASHGRRRTAGSRSSAPAPLAHGSGRRARPMQSRGSTARRGAGRGCTIAFRGHFPLWQSQAITDGQETPDNPMPWLLMMMNMMMMKMMIDEGRLNEGTTENMNDE